jgi:hypothetical protein
MSRGQRLTFLGIAAIIAVVAVIVLSGGGDETEKAADATATLEHSGTPLGRLKVESEASQEPAVTKLLQSPILR